MFEHSVFSAIETVLAPQESLILYSDGITEAEDPQGRPFEESGLEMEIDRHATAGPADICSHVLKAVEGHAKDSWFTDDLTILILKRG